MKNKWFVAFFIGFVTFMPIKKADAESKDYRDVCVALGDAAYQIALNRDNAINKFETRRRVIGAFDTVIRDAVLIVVDMVYEKPWNSPENDAQLIINECIRQAENRVSL